jgi:hypothetical protein
MTTADASTWRCATCSREHSGLATVFGPAAPELWLRASDAERANGEINADMCYLPLADGSSYQFLRGELHIPVRDAAFDRFTWSAWVSLSEHNMNVTADHWSDPDRESLAPMFGSLSSDLPYGQPTTAIPAHVHNRAPGIAPSIQLDPAIDHALVREQLNGITLHRVAELNELLLPRN